MNLHELKNFTDALPNTAAMPVLFLGHGSPMNAIDDNVFVRSIQALSNSLPVPRAIVCISAHWYTQGTQVTAASSPTTIHDFYGFPEELFKVQYPAPGEPHLANHIVHMLSGEAHLDEQWGLDHGAWSVLTHLYPLANVPVIQLSIDYTKTTEQHFELARQLSSLRKKGVLFVGSGNIVHNLRKLDWNNINTVGAGWEWAQEAQALTNKWIVEGNVNPLLEYQQQGEAIRSAVPTPEHFLPLIYTLGLRSTTDHAHLFNDALVGGSLSMTSVLLS